MKHWTGLTVLGLLLVSIWKLPPSAQEPRERDFVLPEVTRASLLDGDVQRTHEQIKHMRWADSLSALALEHAEDGLAMGFPENTDEADRELLRVNGGLVELPEDKKEMLRERVRDELAALQPRSDVVFGYYFQLHDHGTEGSVSLARGESTYLGERDGQAYCIQVFADIWFGEADLRRAVLPFTEATTNATGVCRPYLEYGMPGQHIGAWMEDGAMDFALLPSQPGHSFYQDYRPARRTFFGLNFFGFRNQSVEIDRCMAGIGEACATIMTDPDLLGPRSELIEYLLEHSPVTRLEGNSWLSPFGSLDDYLLADLQAEFGSEAFQRFWSSEQRVPEAFEAAFGMGLGDWMLTWVGANMRISPPGPKLSKSAALGGMLALTLFAAMAGAWARRRNLN